MAANTRHRGFKWTTGDASNPALALLVDETSLALHITNPSDAGTDWNVSAYSHPTVVVHSNTTPATDYISMWHDATDAYLNVASGNLKLAIGGTAEITLTTTALSPTTSDGNALGTTALMWGDLFLASGGVINFNNGNMTITHSAGVLAIAGGATTLAGDATVADDGLLAVGTGSTARLSWDTTDANSNQMLLQLPAAGSVDSPVLVIGQSIESVDLGAAAAGADYSAVVDPRIAIFSSGAVTTGPVIEFRKARGTTAAPTVCTTGDDIGTIDFYGAVANGEYVQGASIRADIAGTIATTRGPATLTFLTATDAAPSVLTQAMIISAAQVVTMASTLTVQGASTTVGVAGTTTGTLILAGGTSGTCTLTPAAAAGSWTMTLPAAANTNAGYQLTCAGADSITSWGAAGSLRELKDIQGEHDAQDALDKILGVKVYDFRYKPGKGTQDGETAYVGLLADEAPWAMHYKGGVVNPVNSLGYTVLGIQALERRIRELEAKLN